MKKSKFTESQIVAILKEGDAGVPVAELVRKHGLSAATLLQLGNPSMSASHFPSLNGCAS